MLEDSLILMAPAEGQAAEWALQLPEVMPQSRETGPLLREPVFPLVFHNTYHSHCGLWNSSISIAKELVRRAGLTANLHFLIVPRWQFKVLGDLYTH